MRTTPSEAYDPIDIASLCLWKQAQSGDNQDRIRRLNCIHHRRKRSHSGYIRQL